MANEELPSDAVCSASLSIQIEQYENSDSISSVIYDLSVQPYLTLTKLLVMKIINFRKECKYILKNKQAKTVSFYPRTVWSSDRITLTNIFP